VLLTQEAFAQHRLDVQLHVTGNGEEAARFLRRTGGFAAAPRPALVLPGLNLPRRSGLEVLAELKADPDLQTIPVVILTTSQAQQDILRSHQLHANTYIVNQSTSANSAPRSPRSITSSSPWQPSRNSAPQVPRRRSGASRLPGGQRSHRHSRRELCRPGQAGDRLANEPPNLQLWMLTGSTASSRRSIRRLGACSPELLDHSV
jgi:CheY-like chemotaxis protein